MIESNSVEVGSGELATHSATGPSFAPPLTAVRPFVGALASARALTVGLLLAIACVVRLVGLGASGFSEDEINKLEAIRAYSRLQFSANAEHPMLMKLADWGSVSAAQWWNAHAPSGTPAIPAEAALRFPNAVAGSVTTVVVFLLAESLFDTTVGAWAALFWALDVNAAAINRIGKEDTFLLLFFLLASYLYERGKALEAVDPVRRDRWFNASGASFGLMLASKYMPHYFGLHVLFNIAADRRRITDTPDKRLAFFVAMGALFLAANFAIALPGTWHYLYGYAHGETLRHSGYNFAHHIYVNTIEATPWGLPPTFYLTFFATKVPLFVLAAAAVGLIWVVRHPTDRGATFLRVFLVFTLLPYSLVASKFLRYMLPVLVMVDIAAAVGVAWVLRQVDALGRPAWREIAAAVVAVIAIAPPLAQQLGTEPFYGLAQNSIGARLGAPASIFPDDELYDAGVREAVEAVTRSAAPGAVVCSDASAVVAEYVRRDGRPDMRSCSIARDGLPMPPVDTWVIVQEAHTYFENAGVIDVLRRRLTPALEIRIGGVRSAQVFHLPAAAAAPAPIASGVHRDAH